MRPKVGTRHGRAASSHFLSTRQEFGWLTQLPAGGIWNINRDVAGSTQEPSSESAVCYGEQAADHRTKNDQGQSHTLAQKL